MGKGESWIPRDRSAQTLDRFVQTCRIAGRAKPVAAHEFRIGQWVFAVPRTALDRQRRQRPVQCARNLPGGLVLEIDKVVRVERKLLFEASALQMSVKHFERKTRLPFRLPNGPSDHKPDTQTRANIQACCLDRQG